MVPYCDVAGPAALVAAVEAAGFVCYGGTVDGIDTYNGELYVQDGLWKRLRRRRIFEVPFIDRKMVRCH